MPQIHFIKPTFSGGEYAPSMYSRVDVSRYSSGAKKMYNFIVHPHGGASNRPGWHFAAMAKYASKKCRMHDFQFSSTQTYALEFGDQYVRFYTNNGQIAVSSPNAWMTSTAYVVGNFVTQTGTIYYCIVSHTSGTFATDLAASKWVAQTIYEVPMPYSETDLPDLNFTQSADVLFMFHKNFQPRQLNRLGATNWTVTLYDFLYGPYQIPNSDITFTITPSGTTGSITLTASSALFASSHVGALFNINHNVAEQSVSSSLGSATNGSSITCGGTWRIITHGTWAATIAVQKSTDGGSTWTNIRSFSSASDFNANTFGTEDMSNNAPNFLVRLNCSSYTSGTIGYTLTCDAFRNVGHVKITAYTSATQVTGTVTKTLGGTTATFDWAEGSWSDYRGWPAVGEFNQDRLVTGNTANEPQTIWQTKSSNYYDYSRNSPLVDSDGITTNIPSRQLNGINGFVPLTQLIALTSSSEWGIGSVDAVMSPLTITQKIYGYNGSAGLKPVIIKNRAVYVQFMGAVILDLGYELLSNTFTGSDLSILANHLFNGYSIKDMCYQQYPDSLVWVVRDDGFLLSLTYLREQEVVAWAQHETDGSVESLCSIPATDQFDKGYNQVWLSVLRGDDRFIEYMDHRMSSTLPEDQFFVDCGITFNGTEPDAFCKLYLPFDGVNNSTTFTDGEITPKTVTGVNTTNVYISTAQSKFGGASGLFTGNSGNDEYTKLLLHCDGNDATTTFTDSSSSAKTMTAQGNARVSTAQSKFGGAAGYFNTGIDSTVVLMLHCDGTDASTTITDSSASAHTMTAVGNAALSTSAPKFGTAALLLDGTGDYVTTPSSTDFDMGSGDWTVDFWVKLTAQGVGDQVFVSRMNTGGSPQIYLALALSDQLYVSMSNTSSVSVGNFYTTASVDLTTTWHHVAFVRSGSSFYMFLDGVNQTLTTATALGTMAASTGVFYVGAYAFDGSSGVHGRMDELRVSKGLARWTSGFTVPQTPYSAYSAGDYLTTPDSADWNLGTSDFTIDGWVNFTSIAKGQPIVSQSTDANNFWIFYWQTDNALKFVSKNAGVQTTIVSGTFTPVTNTWYHVAVSRSGNSLYLFINGSLSGGAQSFSVTVPDLTSTLKVARDSGAQIFSDNDFTGFIDELRLTKGLARWTASFTAPIAPYSAPGYLTLADSADWNFGTGDWTIESQVYLNSLLANQTIWSQGTDSTHYAALQFDGTHFTFVSPNGAAVTLTSTSTIAISTWYHVAVVRYGNVWKLYINGVSEASVTSSGTYSNYTGVFAIGTLFNGSANQYLSAYLDEFKVAKGVARWTANFMPPTVPGFSYSANTITGLDHLEGKLVSILADGVVQPQQTVVGGQIGLSVTASKVHVGLPYASDLETLNIEAPLPDGTMQGRKLKISKVTVRVLNSKGGYIGPDENHLKAIDSVFADYRSATDLYTGDLKVSLTGGFSDGGRMFIRQTDPLPITVLALMPLVSVAGTAMESA